MVENKEKKISPIRETDAAARAQARELLINAKFASIGVLAPSDGYPMVSRIAVMAGDAGEPIFLASDLSGHSKALEQDNRASIMFGEPPEKGDPLAFPRITLVGRVEKITRQDTSYVSMREAWLKKHPKSQLYIDFGDFNFYKMRIERAALNGGFGKAYELNADDVKPSSS